MGYTGWSDDDYLTKEKVRKMLGKSAFEYTDETMKNVRSENRICHQRLDPKGVIRESRDSATHPESLAICVIFDHTGSMEKIPRVLQRKLNTLMGFLLEKGYVEHPQVLFGAVGDAISDRAPLQIGQFESGIEMDNDLGLLLLEGNGGPWGQESYELALYFVSRHTSVDCWEKRKKKGYLFLIGDEFPYGVKANEVREIIGDELGQPILTEGIVAEVKEKYHTFFIIPTLASGGKNPEVAREWTLLLGQEYVVKIDDPEVVSETIALIIGVMEGKTTAEEGIKNLQEMGLSGEAIKSVSLSLSSVIGKKLRTPADKAPEAQKPGAKNAGKGKTPKIGRL